MIFSIWPVLPHNGFAFKSQCFDPSYCVVKIALHVCLNSSKFHSHRNLEKHVFHLLVNPDAVFLVILAHDYPGMSNPTPYRKNASASDDLLCGKACEAATFMIVFNKSVQLLINNLESLLFTLAHQQCIHVPRLVLLCPANVR